MGLKIRHNGEITEFTGAKYDPGGLGSMRLNIRTGSGANDIKKYGLATSASHSSDKKLRLNVNNSTYYIGTSALSSRQSNYTSYSSYYTYTYTQTQQRNSVLTRAGTQTTATKTMPAKYTYEQRLSSGVLTTYYTNRSITWLNTQEAILSGTRSSQYTAQFSLSWNRSDFGKYSASYRAANANMQFTSPVKVYSYTTTVGGTDSSTSSSSTYPGTNAYSGSVGQQEAYNWTGSYTANCVQRYSATTSRTINTVYYASTTKHRIANYTNIRYQTASRSSTYYSQAPNYIRLGAINNGLSAGGEATYTVNAANFKSTTVSQTGYDGVSNNVSYRRKTSISATYTNSSLQRTVSAGYSTRTSTNNNFPAPPSPWAITGQGSSSQASYTYTDADCTKTYASNYSTSYWTEINTYNSSPWYRSSLGSTATTRSSEYVDHNFV